MSFTRFHDDPIRIQKQLQQQTYSGRYLLNTPGQGLDLPYIEEPQIRLQGWGANDRKNMVSIESDLLGLSRPLNRDNIDINNYQTNAFVSSEKTYSTSQPFVQESRASHPAWMYKDLEQTRWETPLLNPLYDIEKKFHDNIQTRILEKDYFQPSL